MRRQRSPPLTDGNETNPEEPSSWGGDSSNRKMVEPAPDVLIKFEPTREDSPQYGPELENEVKTEPKTEPNYMEVDAKIETGIEITPSRKRCNRIETTSTSSSSDWSRSPSARTELTQRSENLMEMTRTMVRAGKSSLSDRVPRPIPRVPS